MKATDLIIGDYVKYQGCIYIIKEISAKGWVHLIHSEAKVRVNMTSDYIIDLLEPIPLTSEILEKIGFYWGYTSSEEDSINNMPKEDIPIPLIMPDKHWCYDNENGGEVTIELPNESDGGLVTVSNNDRRIEFVFDKPICLYELQHLLRLCGLNKLADNLKMEE